jgi:radical SAM protein with 4Fe4S-binding SPASM domain
MRKLRRWIGDAYTGLPRRYLSGMSLPPLRLALTVTYRCNLNCRMCLQRVEDRNTRRAGITELTGEEIRNLIRQTIPRVSQVGFCGGEIFLRKDIMDLLHFAAARNRVGLVTNGTLLTSELAGELVRMKIGLMLFSVDGPAKIHDEIRGRDGTYARVMAAIESVRRAETDQQVRESSVHVNCVVMPNNIDTLHDLVREVSTLGVRHLDLQVEDRCAYRFSCVTDMKKLFQAPARLKTEGMGDVRAKIEDVQRFAAERQVEISLKPECTTQEFADYYAGEMSIAEHTCRLPWSQTMISPHGDVYCCYMLKMGNIREQPLLKVWNGTPYREFRKKLSRIRLFPQCYGCCFMQPRHASVCEKSNQM